MLNVNSAIIFYTLLDGRLSFSDLSILSKKISKNCLRELLYIQLTPATSIIVKYKAEPLIATGLYYSLLSLISLVFISASINLAATSFYYVFVLFNTSTNSVSSNKLP